MHKKNKIALVTGAGSGIGKHLSILLSKKNYHVLLIGRNLNNLEKVDNEIKQVNGSSSIVNLDLDDFQGIDNLGLEIFKKYKKLDLLVLNAGILGTLGPLSHQDPSEFENVLRINLISNFRLLRSLDYLLKKSDEGNILCISSGAAHGFRAYWGAYSISKAALEQMAMIWKAENKHNNVNIRVINPGATRTKMRALAMPGEDPNTIKSAKTTAEKIIQILTNQKEKENFKINL